MLKSPLILLTIVALNLCGAYKLLAVFPFPGQSHSILGEGYVRHLLNAGHEVTYITAIPIKKPIPNLRQIEVVSNFDKMPMGQVLDLSLLLSKEVDMSDMSMIFRMMYNVSNNTILHENVQKLLHDPKEQFDAVIVEWMYSELYSGFSAVFNCPLIWSSSMDPHVMVLSLIDQAPNPAYTPDHMSTKIPPFSFWDRVEELWAFLLITYHKMLLSSIENESFEKAYGPAVEKRGGTLPPLNVVKYNGSLMLGNSHVSAGQAIALPQNYIPILGYHIDNDVKPLPEDLRKIMDNAKNGVIYFSLGSNLKSKSLPDDIKKDLLKMFGELKQTVLWKFEEVLPDMPKNVHILQWAPQQSILAHPSCILFITHGGLLSTTETLHYGVPIIGIPVFADQFINVERAVKLGIAKKVDLSYNMVGPLKVAIEDVTTNPIYRQRTKELSTIYHDRPISPGAELVHWVEHVVRSRGAPHLRSPALHVPFYQKMYLDLLAIISVALILITLIVKRLLFFNKTRINIKKKIN